MADELGEDNTPRGRPPADPLSETDPLHRLLAIMAALRDPDHGCPWDLSQDFASIAPHTIEEAYEVAEAIAGGDMAELRDELGDLLFQVVYHARMAEERGAFDFSDVAHAIAEKMVRRHPHVFGGAVANTASDVAGLWEAIKAEERAQKGRAERYSLLDDVPVALPGLARAWKLHKKATRAGFDWPDHNALFAKIREELNELEAEISAGRNPERLADEFGDVLFTVTRLAGVVDQDPEAAMRGAQRKFTRRFQYMEERLRVSGRQMADVAAEELEALWAEAKSLERDGS